MTGEHAANNGRGLRDAEEYHLLTDPLGGVPSRFATLDGVRIHYKSLGDGETAVVFIHGWTCNLTFWGAQVKDLAGKGRLLFVDLPGHGRSDKPKRAYTMDYFAQAVEAVRKNAGVKDLALIGHSMGTPVMRQYYRAHPERTRALVAVDGSLEPFVKPAEIDQYIAQYTGVDYLDKLGKAVDGMFARNTPGDVRAAIKNAMLSTPHHVVVSALKGMLDPAIWKDDQVSVPLLQVSAKLPWWPPDYEAYVRKLAPKVEYHVLDDAGHFLMLDRPGDFNALLTAFLRRQEILKP
jgi:pimeloyl-ACP methyl ester carboxylesterase